MSKKFTLHYVVRNNSDGSASASFFGDAKSAQLASDIEDEGGEAYGDNPHAQKLEFDDNGTLLNPDSTRAELLEELGREDDGDTAAPAKKFNKAAKKDPAAFTGTIWYVLRNGGDGSANVGVYADEETANLAAEAESEPFNDNGPYRQDLKYDAKGTLLNPSSTLAELKAELAEKRGETVEDEPEAPAAANSAIAGKTVVFTGALSTMTRKEAEAEATAMGALVSHDVTKKTDILVYGADPGSKLRKAVDHGVKVIINEGAWNKMKSAAPAAAKRTSGPKP